MAIFVLSVLFIGIGLFLVSAGIDTDIKSFSVSIIGFISLIIGIVSIIQIIL